MITWSRYGGSIGR